MTQDMMTTLSGSGTSTNGNLLVVIIITIIITIVVIIVVVVANVVQFSKPWASIRGSDSCLKKNRILICPIAWDVDVCHQCILVTVILVLADNHHFVHRSIAIKVASALELFQSSSGPALGFGWISGLVIAQGLRNYYKIGVNNVIYT